MTDKKLVWWQIGGFVFSVIFGSLFHFIYQWSGNNIFTAAFSAVNESTWEHMKILFFPTFIFALAQSFLMKGEKNFWGVKLIGILTAIFLIPVLFYTLNGIFGKTPAWVNIALFILSALIGFMLEFFIFKKQTRDYKASFLGFFGLCITALLFIIFTFSPPKIPLFLDPLTNFYGIKA